MKWLDSLPRAQRDKAYLLVSKIRTSKERKARWSMLREALKNRKLVFINFGKVHGFKMCLRKSRQRTTWNMLHLIKIDLELKSEK